MTIGAEIDGRRVFSIPRTPLRVTPAASARSVARWMTGPSASGSENGTPISSTSAPARSSRVMISAERVRSGSPAVTYVTRPVFPALRSCAKRSSILGTGALLEDLLHAVDVLVAAAGQVDDEDGVLRELRRDLHHVRDGVRRLEGRQDALEAGQLLEAAHRFIVGRVCILGAAGLLQVRVLGPNGRVIEAGRDGVRQLDVAVLILQHERARA